MNHREWSWRRLSAAVVESLERNPVDEDTLKAAARIVDAVRTDGENGVRHFAELFGERNAEQPLVLTRDILDRALKNQPPERRELLDRTAARIRNFAEAQRNSLQAVKFPIPGGRVIQEIAPVESTGCYAPGGRYPLPSSVLMTVVTARAAGVAEVWAASPRPTEITLAAAAVAGADGLLAVGGAQAVAALAYGLPGLPACDVIVGPGNRWVTAAKKIVNGTVGIDMLAGPSELVVLADATADPEVVAADLLAQAEHDPDAQPVLVCTDVGLIDAVEAEIRIQVSDLPTAETALAALENGFAVEVANLDEAIRVCDRLAPEHLEVMVEDAAKVADRLRAWGGLFVGAAAAEVLGDYGAGPNHTLPTGGVARFKGGLAVFDFLRIRTRLEIDDPAASQELVSDAVDLARIEGLEAHARSAERRLEDRRG